MTRVEALGGIVYDIFRLPVEREEALEGLARQNTPEAIEIRFIPLRVLARRYSFISGS